MDDGHPYDDTVSFDFTLKPRTNPNPTLILILIQALEVPRHFAERHFAERHFADGHFVERTV